MKKLLNEDFLKEINLNHTKGDFMALKGKLRLLGVVIDDVIKEINKIEGGKNAKEFKA